MIKIILWIFHRIVVWGIPFFILGLLIYFIINLLRNNTELSSGIFQYLYKKDHWDILIGIFTLLIAYIAYVKGSSYLDTWLMFQMTDKCFGLSAKFIKALVTALYLLAK